MTFRFPIDDEEYEVEYFSDSIEDSMPTEVYYQEWLYPPKVCVAADESKDSVLKQIVETWKNESL